MNRCPRSFDPEEAMLPGAPEIHPANPKIKEDLIPISAARPKPPSGETLRRDFKEADYVREDRFESHLRTHGYLEPQATVASFEFRTENWMCGRRPKALFIKRAKLAKTLGLPQSSVRVRKAYVGGAFGGKIDLFLP